MQNKKISNKYSPKHHFQTKKILENSKKIPCLQLVDLSFHPPITERSTNNFTEDNNLQ